MEDVEAKRCDESVTQGILLVKVSWDSAGFFVPPGTPLIEHKGYVLFRIIFVHDGAVLFDNVFYLTAFTHCPVIIVFVELCGCSFTSAPAGYGVIMERESVHTSTYAVHQDFSPVIIVIACTTGNLKQMVAVVVAAVGGVTAIQISVIFRTHASAASPTFVTYTEVFHFPCFVTTVLAAKSCHRRISFGSHVFYPFCQFFYSTTTYVSADIRFSTQHFAEVEELMCTETVVFNCTSPVIVYHFGAVLFRTDTVHPVIFIGKAATRPTKYGNLKFFQCIEYVGTITFDIGNIRIFSYPKSTIDTGAQMFGKLAVDFFGNNLCALVGMKRDRCTLLCGQRYGCS